MQEAGHQYNVTGGRIVRHGYELARATSWQAETWWRVNLRRDDGS